MYQCLHFVGNFYTTIEIKQICKKKIIKPITFKLSQFDVTDDAILLKLNVQFGIQK